MVTWAQLANVHGFGSMYLRVPGVLKSQPYLPRSCHPSAQAISGSQGDAQGDVRYLFRDFWLFIMALLQYWEEAAEGIGPFGGPCHPDSALMLFVLSRINHLLDTRCEITRIEVRLLTDWDRYAQEELSAQERSVMWEEYCHNKANQKRLRRDIHVAYTEEAFIEQVDLEKFHRDFYLFPMLQLDQLSRPGYITLSTPYIAPRANGCVLQKPEAARMQREFARWCRAIKDTMPIPLGQGGTPTSAQLKKLTGQAGAQRGREQGARPKEKPAPRRPAAPSSAAGAAPLPTLESAPLTPAEPSVELVPTPRRPGTPNLDENGDELDYVDDLDQLDPGLPEGLNLDDTIHSIHSVPRTPGHWDDDEDLDATAVLEYSRTGTAMGEGVEPLLASTPSHFSSSLATPIVPSSPASVTLHITVPPQGSVAALPEEDNLVGPTDEATAQEELDLMRETTVDGFPVEALNPGLREAAGLVPNLTPEGLNQLQALIDAAQRRSRPSPPPRILACQCADSCFRNCPRKRHHSHK